VGEALAVVKRGPVGHCIVRNRTGIEALIRNSEIVLDEQWVMYQTSFVGESPIDSASMQT